VVSKRRRRAADGAVALRRIGAFAPGSMLAMTFLLALELADPEMRPALEIAEKGSRASGTPFLSYYSPVQILAVAREAGFKQVQPVSATTLTQRCFAGRMDGLHPPSKAVELSVAAI
jgi:hypothetical protein